MLQTERVGAAPDLNAVVFVSPAEIDWDEDGVNSSRFTVRECKRRMLG